MDLVRNGFAAVAAPRRLRPRAVAAAGAFGLVVMLAGRTAAADPTYMEIDFSGQNYLQAGELDTFSGVIVYDLAAMALGAAPSEFPLVSASLTQTIVRYGTTEYDQTDTYSSPSSFAIPQSRAQAANEANVTFYLNGPTGFSDVSLRLGLSQSFPGGMLPQTVSTYAGAVDFYLLNGSVDDRNLTVREFLITPAPIGAPEPAAWALLLLGFGGAGAALRRRRGNAAPGMAQTAGR